MPADFHQPVRQPHGSAAAQSLTLQPLGKRLADRVRQGLASQCRDLAGETVGLLVLETQCHVLPVYNLASDIDVAPVLVEKGALRHAIVQR
jgi:hypothetical protein